MALRTALLSFLVVVFLFAPVANAQEDVALPAGFAPSTVWLSRNPPVAGEALRIYTVVYNGSDRPLEGSVSFLVDEVEVGTASFSLFSGDSKVLSTQWTPDEGTHSVSGTITSLIDSKTKDARSVSTKASTVLSVQVASQLPQPAAPEALTAADSIIASTSPRIIAAFAEVASATESLRAYGETYLTNLATSSPPVANEATSTELFVPENTNPTLMQEAAKILLPVFANPALFYLVFIGTLLLLFFLLVRRMRGPRRR
jgi:hypothetical protein